MSENEVYLARLADIPVRYSFRFDATKEYLLPYVESCEGSDCDILADREYIESQRPYYSECTEDGYVEYKSLISLTSLYLLPKRCCIFHAAAFWWNDRAWLMTAPPGTGKTTQYKNWKILYRYEVEMISGDMPILDFRQKDTIWVHPSPWNGKERLRGSKSGKLGGIVYLEQGAENVMERWEPEESIIPVLQQFAVSPQTVEQIKLVTSFENQLLRQIPVWKFINRGDKPSTVLMRDTFERCLAEKEL